jgi:uncharacterized repeat protein (TIGR04076 family)
MYELKVTVTKVMGECTADPPMKPGDYFTVNDGDIQIPEGGYICLWALQSLMPVITPKEREISEEKDQDWMWRVSHAQCPDPDGRVIFKIEQTRKLDKNAGDGRNGEETEVAAEPSAAAGETAAPAPADGADEADSADTADMVESADTHEGMLRNLEIEVESINGKCTSRMKPGDRFSLRSGRLYIPPGRHMCLYAMHATLPLLPAKQRALQDGDWMLEDSRVLCPDPAGNVILRIDRKE